MIQEEPLGLKAFAEVLELRRALKGIISGRDSAKRAFGRY